MNNSPRSSPCPECGGTGRKVLSPSQWVECDACDAIPPLNEELSTANHWLLVFLPIILIGTFLWRFLVTAHEFPSTGMRNFSIGLDLLCLVSLIGLWVMISRKQLPVGRFLHLIFWLGLFAGLGLFVIRLSGSTQSWWTGHLYYKLSPRTTIGQGDDRRVVRAADTAANDTKTGSNAAESDSPTAVYKAFYAAYNNKDNEAMKTMISRGEFRSLDFADKKKADERNEQTLKKLLERPMGSSDDTRNEKINGDTATVECLNPKGVWYTRNFVKEDGKWKLID